MSKENNSTELNQIKERYLRRNIQGKANLYNPLTPSVYMSVQEKERALIRLINKHKLFPLNNKKVLEIGCGQGSNLTNLINLGCEPKNIYANELLEERVVAAKKKLPLDVNILLGDALDLTLDPNQFDIVLQSTVFSSILDSDFRLKLANKMWALVKPGGGVLWYDFIYNNPKNKDVKGVPVSEIKKLFPEGKLIVNKITLAPPINRVVTRLHPSAYALFNVFPFLRSHVLCWIQK